MNEELFAQILKETDTFPMSDPVKPGETRPMPSLPTEWTFDSDTEKLFAGILGDN